MGSSSSFLSCFFRTAFRNKGLMVVNVGGLAVGLAITMFLLVYLQFEFSYDRHFQDADRIYRVLSVRKGQGTEILPINLGSLAGRLVKEIPEVEAAGRLYRSGGLNLSREGGEVLKVNTYAVDSAFLHIFDFRLVWGEWEGVLRRPENCIVTRTTAARFFGEGTNPVGQSLLTPGGQGYRITAVIEDVPQNTHFQFDVLTKLPEWEGSGLEYLTYLKFWEETDADGAIAKCRELNVRLLEERFKPFSAADFDCIVEPLGAIHTATQVRYDLSPTVNRGTLIFIILVALFILGTALSNFIALYMVQGEQRALEISIRKTNGANRWNIGRMLFGETLAVTFLAFALALGLFYRCGEMLRWLLNFNFPFEAAITGTMWVNFLGLFVVVALIAGGYPAYYLSRFDPAVLIRKSVRRKYRLTAVSVVFQFSVVFFCISALSVVWRQLDYIRNMSVGFQPREVLEAWVGNNLAGFDRLQAELKAYPFIEAVTVAQCNPLGQGSGESVRRADQTEKESRSVTNHRIGPHYFQVYRIPLLAGRYFSVYPEEEARNIILTQAVVRALELEEPIGKKIWFNDRLCTVVGVVGDVVNSAYEENEERVYTIQADNFYMLAIRFLPGTYREAKQALEKVTGELFPGIPIGVYLTEDIIRTTYYQEEVTSRILLSGSILAILLALLGLLALMGFVTRQKQKEIGIRRALGARVGEIVAGLHRYVILRILPAIPIGVSVSYFFIKRWLETFTYAVSLNIWSYIGTLLVMMLVVSLIISVRTLKAALANPVEALKSE